MFTNSFSSVFALGKSRDAHPKKKCILSPHRILLPVGALILLVGVALLLLVAIELTLRNLYALIRGPEGLRDIPDTVMLGSGAE